jgi:hypothetical protein
MALIYEKNISKIHDEYMLRATELLQGFIFEGIMCIYANSEKMYAQLMQIYNMSENKKTKPNKQVVFQNLLATTKEWSRDRIEKETNRIRKGCDTDIFDLLIKATIKSNITLFTCGYSMRENAELFVTYYNKIDIGDVIHKCYIYTSKRFYNNPELFVVRDIIVNKNPENKNISEVSEISPCNIKEIKRLINEGISEGIWKSLPLKDVLNGYLNLKPIYEDTNLEDLAVVKSNNLKSQLGKESDLKTKETSKTINVPVFYEHASAQPNEEKMTNIQKNIQPKKNLKLSNIVERIPNRQGPVASPTQQTADSNIEKASTITRLNPGEKIGTQLNSFHSNKQKKQDAVSASAGINGISIKPPRSIQKPVEQFKLAQHALTNKKYTAPDDIQEIDIKTDSENDYDENYNAISRARGESTHNEDSDDDDDNNENESEGDDIEQAVFAKLDNTINPAGNRSNVGGTKNHYETLEEYSNSVVYRNKKNT